MKKMIARLCSGAVAILLITAIISATYVSAHNNTYLLGRKNISIDTGNWVFTANTMIPQFGRTRQENGEYTVSYKPGKLVVYLPYVGRADATANTFLDHGPLDFTSAKFTIDKREKKKGEWVITISPKDYGEVRSMIFTFYDNGSADLDVILTSRSGISFRGTMEDKR